MESGERSCHSDYHQSPEWISLELEIEPAISCYHVMYATDWAMLPAFCGKIFSLVPESRLYVKVKVKYQGHIFQKLAVTGVLVFHIQFV